MIFLPESIQTPLVILGATLFTVVYVALDHLRWLREQRRDEERRKQEHFADACQKSERRRVVHTPRMWEQE